jgi:hypothetical protein
MSVFFPVPVVGAQGSKSMLESAAANTIGAESSKTTAFADSVDSAFFICLLLSVFIIELFLRGCQEVKLRRSEKRK